MKPMLLVQLAMDATTLLLLLAGLAYYWLDNLAHELIGTAMFVLLVVHAVFNRRWYLALFKGSYGPRRRLAAAVNLSFLAMMLVLLVSSVLVSRSLFSFLSLEGLTARQVHKFAAYWVVAIVGLHLGLQWAVVMKWLRNRFVAEDSAVRVALLRVTVLAVGAYGVQSSFDMAFGSKLVMRITLDMWDFNESMPLFFANYLSIVGLYAALTHYGAGLLRQDRPSRSGLLNDGSLGR